MNQTLCIIPARGGSKRIPYKNIKDFLGKPIIAYSIKAALESELFDEVIVSTNNKEISKIAIEFGAKVPFIRSEENANDFATTIDVVNEVLNDYKSVGKIFSKVCVLYPTSPLVSVLNLQKGYKKLNHYDAVIPVAEYSSPIQRAFIISDKVLKYKWPEFEKSRSQDLDRFYYDAGQWYWINVQSIKDTLVPLKTSYILLDKTECHDIDTLSDWEMAELKYRKIRKIK